VDDFYDILSNKYGRGLLGTHVTLRVDNIILLVYKSRYVISTYKKLNNLDNINELINQLYDDHVLLHKNVQINLKLITKTCSLQLNHLNPILINKIHEIHHELYQHWFLLYQYFKYNNDYIPFDIFTHIIQYYVNINNIYSNSKKRFKNCKSVCFMYNQYKCIKYNLCNNGKIQFSYRDFDHFFKTFKLLLTSIKKLSIDKNGIKQSC
jgi:hypothetical protein